MVTWRTRKFDISSKLEEKRDGRFHFDRLNHSRKPPRPLWWTLALLIIILILLMYLRKMI